MLASTTGASPATLYLGFGILCGLGAGFAYNAVMSTMSLWFPDKQGLISGILLMGFGLSSFIIGKVFAAVTPSDGTDKWQATFRVLGIIIVIVMVICSFFFVKPEAGYNPGAGSAKAKAVREPACEVNTGKNGNYADVLVLLYLGNSGKCCRSCTGFPGKWYCKSGWYDRI